MCFGVNTHGLFAGSRRRNTCRKVSIPGGSQVTSRQTGNNSTRQRGNGTGVWVGGDNQVTRNEVGQHLVVGLRITGDRHKRWSQQGHWSWMDFKMQTGKGTPTLYQPGFFLFVLVFYSFKSDLSCVCAKPCLLIVKLCMILYLFEDSLCPLTILCLLLVIIHLGCPMVLSVTPTPQDH